MKTILTGLTTFCCLILISCQFNGTNINEEQVKRDAVAVTDKLYEYIEKDNYAAADRLFSKGMFKTTNKDSLNAFLKRNKEVLGIFKSRVLSNWGSRTVTGTNPVTECKLVYTSGYTKYDAVETISLVKEDGVMKILGYHVDSKAYLK